MLSIDQIQRAIEKKAPGEWTAAETSAWRRGAAAGGDPGLFGLRLGDPGGMLKVATGSLLEELTLPPPPPSFDWRAENGGRVAAARDQGDCGACVGFATAAAVESGHWIDQGELVELSEAELFHCNGGSCEDGWGLAAGLSAAMKGMAALGDAPWSSSPRCLGLPPVVRVTDLTERRTDAARKRAIVRGPVVGGMRVHEDFLAYGSGIYRHVTGSYLANHAVCIVGYDDTQACWIAKNSWGPDFGEEGCFRIAYGECGMQDLPFYSCETVKA